VITVQIPAAIRACSPVVVTGPDGYEQTGTVAFMFDGPWVTIPPLGGEQMPQSIWIPGWVGASVALNISDPTGAAHLARWLIHDAPRRAEYQHTAHLDAIGAESADFLAALDLARTMMGDKLAPRGLEILRDYALRVVSNG